MLSPDFLAPGEKGKEIKRFISFGSPGLSAPPCRGSDLGEHSGDVAPNSDTVEGTTLLPREDITTVGSNVSSLAVRAKDQTSSKANREARTPVRLGSRSRSDTAPASCRHSSMSWREALLRPTTRTFSCGKSWPCSSASPSPGCRFFTLFLGSHLRLIMNIIQEKIDAQISSRSCIVALD
ncbi:homeobox protein orthopedia [Limosa lapponica baueri]|uniref:Homeobox protein orthopedia n=1 Tax=Limosa lapponica baueri TaxID=1758121 RepID=A0A2I0TVT4_LIMLA|nr:homeobox protein orthopedia [Limosa lapponica baueri]